MPERTLMTRRKNLPVAIPAQAVAMFSEQRGSLVARGLATVQNSKNSISPQSKFEKLESLLKSLTPTTRIAVLNAALEQKIERTQNDSLYRQARDTFDGKYGIINWNVGSKKGNNRKWNEATNPTMYSAFKILQQLANENYGKAYYSLAILYRDRIDIEDGHIHAGHYTHLAFNWCMENQANIDGELWCDLGDMHYPWTVNYGVTYSREIAGAYYRKAAEQGYAKGQWEFGYMYHCGSVVKQNYQQAAYWYLKAAEQDNSGFQYDLGKMYFHGGEVVEQNYQQAMYWFRKAAEQGDFRGVRLLGILYKYGMGVPKDETEAAKWLQIAAEQSDADAQETLQELNFNRKE